MQRLHIKIIAVSFGLVFLAELGDKTQLTAMALAASRRSAWAVFIGTSLGLVAATALAVLLGSALARNLPQKLLHILSAVVFILIGVVLLVSLACKAPASVSRHSEENTNQTVKNGSKTSEYNPL